MNRSCLNVDFVFRLSFEKEYETFNSGRIENLKSLVSKPLTAKL